MNLQKINCIHSQHFLIHNQQLDLSGDLSVRIQTDAILKDLLRHGNNIVWSNTFLLHSLWPRRSKTISNMIRAHNVTVLFQLFQTYIDPQAYQTFLQQIWPRIESVSQTSSLVDFKKLLEKLQTLYKNDTIKDFMYVWFFNHIVLSISYIA